MSGRALDFHPAAFPEPTWPKGTRLRMQTRERGIVEMAVDQDGKTIERVPESITVEQAWLVTPDGHAHPLFDVKSVSCPNGCDEP